MIGTDRNGRNGPRDGPVLALSAPDALRAPPGVTVPTVPGAARSVALSLTEPRPDFASAGGRVSATHLPKSGSLSLT
jgi:hypothetical protein